MQRFECHALLVQVEGKVTGSFQSGYLAEVAVNGFTYHAMLFSPYLALATPASMSPPMVHSTKASEQHAGELVEPLQVLPQQPDVLDPTAMVPQAKSEDGIPQVMEPTSRVDFSGVPGAAAG